MTQTVDKSSEKKFIERLQNGTANRGPDWVKEIRRRGVARFEEMGLPNRKQEVWRFTNVEPIIQTPFHQRTRHGDHGLAQKQIQSFLFGAGACAELVFVNGLYAPELSNLLDLPLGVDATSLTRGVSDYSRVVKSHLDKYL